MATIQTVPNQWVIKVVKDSIGEDTTYMRTKISSLEKSAKDLKAGAFKLWVYFSKNQDNYTFALSPTHIQESFGMNKKQYDNARQELIEKGYLIRQRGNYYIFCETPIVIDEEELRERNREESRRLEEERQLKQFIKDIKNS